jgi:hypothetical protein
MTAQPRKSEPAGGDGLLLYIATSVVIVVAAEAAFIALASWWLLAVVLAGVLVATLGVVASVLRTIDHDTVASLPAPRPAQPAARPVPTVAHRSALAGR